MADLRRLSSGASRPNILETSLASLIISGVTSSDSDNASQCLANESILAASSPLITLLGSSRS